MRILLIYATVEGQTRKIAGHIEDALSKQGHSVQKLDASADLPFPDVQEFDASIIAGPVHAGHFPGPMRRLVKKHTDELMARPGAFVTVSLTAQSDDENEVAEIARVVEKFSEETGWWPVSVHNAAGALKYTEYDFFKRWMMKRIVAKEGGPVDTSHDYEFTDWKALEAFVTEFAKEAPLAAGKV